MCSSPKMPKMKDPEPLPTPAPLPPTPPPVQPQQAPIMQPQAPMPVASVNPAPPPMPIQDLPTPQAPPPQLVDPGSEDAAIVKRRKSKRKELQQASKGTDALRINLNKSIGATPTGTTGSTGLNIPS